jgi:lipopolysaccharide/colanic/teichoic acid biosynthesis glycosyltransferase
LPILALATFAVAALTLLTSPGPIFFCQERVGFRGRRFKLYKFRTMHVRAETVSHQRHLAALIHSNAPMEKLDCCGDKRLVPGGAWIRASGLDELPQIINVLRGEMSIVGPRPCLPYEYEEYTPAQRERFACVPGLTGLWQVSGKNRTTFEQMVNLDLAYSRQPSPWLDLRIIVMTIPALCIQVSDTVKAHHHRVTRKVSAKNASTLALPT